MDYQQSSYRHHHVLAKKTLANAMLVKLTRKSQHDVRTAEHSQIGAASSNPNRGAAGFLHSYDPAIEVEVQELITNDPSHARLLPSY